MTTSTVEKPAVELPYWEDTYLLSIPMALSAAGWLILGEFAVDLFFVKVAHKWLSFLSPFASWVWKYSAYGALLRGMPPLLVGLWLGRRIGGTNGVLHGFIGAVLFLFVQHHFEPFFVWQGTFYAIGSSTYLDVQAIMGTVIGAHLGFYSRRWRPVHLPKGVDWESRALWRTGFLCLLAGIVEMSLPTSILTNKAIFPHGVFVAVFGLVCGLAGASNWFSIHPGSEPRQGQGERSESHGSPSAF